MPRHLDRPTPFEKIAAGLDDAIAHANGEPGRGRRAATMPAPADPANQLERFTLAVQLLGGQRAVASYLGVNERHVRYLLSGERDLHDGILRDVAAALVAHADACRTLERRIFPAFSGNLTQRQADRKGKPDARRHDQRDAIDG